MGERLTPEHPAANQAFDEQGRLVQLHLSEAEIRLECLKLTMAHGARFDDAVSRAGQFAVFVLGTAPAVSKAPEPVNLKADAPNVAMAQAKAAHKPAPITVRTVEFPPGSLAFELTKEPDRPALSEATRAELRRKALALRDQHRRDEHHRDNARSTAEAYDSKLAGIRAEFEAIESDLGEPPAP